ncbi:MAG: alpha/beta hydrolase, partial [bacterium]
MKLAVTKRGVQMTLIVLLLITALAAARWSWTTPLMPSATIAYAQTPEGPLLLDLYQPHGQGNGAMVLFFHAGGWFSGDRRNAGPDSVLVDLWRQGYVVASADYRLVPTGVFPNNLRDCRAALRWCQIHAPEFGADPNR